jgi:hypothetical protein
VILPTGIGLSANAWSLTKHGNATDIILVTSGSKVVSGTNPYFITFSENLTANTDFTLKMNSTLASGIAGSFGPVTMTT